MPLPTPFTGEEKEHFLDRCMEDPVMNEEFTTADQRYAVCNQRWDDNKFYIDIMKYKFVTSKKEVEKQLKSKDGAPVVYMAKGELNLKQEKKEDEVKTIINLSVQTIDRDGEIVLIDGIRLPEDKEVPLLDAHNSWGSVVDNLYGLARNLRKVEIAGVKALQGTPLWAPCYDERDNLVNPRAKAAQLLVQAGIAKTVSIGFAIHDYDFENSIITDSELYEVSLVSVPANPLALIENDTESDAVKELEKRLKWFKDERPKLKSYRDVFMSQEFCDILKYEKTGDEILDIANMYDLLIAQFNVKETPTQSKMVEETPKPTKEELKSAVMRTVFGK